MIFTIEFIAVFGFGAVVFAGGVFFGVWMERTVKHEKRLPAFKRSRGSIGSYLPARDGDDNHKDVTSNGRNRH